MEQALVRSQIPGLAPPRRGKVRDVYDLGERLLIVSTDRLSAFDCILPTPIPGKGRLLTQISAFWFKKTRPIVQNHFLSAELPAIQAELPRGVRLPAESFEGRCMLVHKAKRIDIECVARGYLAGSGWKEYQQTGRVCGHELPAGLLQAAKLPRTIFTPATKNDSGHDQNISRRRLAEMIGPELSSRLERLTLALYDFAADFLMPRGLILADTKFEFGLRGDALILIDEALTPDSSRVWERQRYAPGSSPDSYDKQFVRDYLERCGWDKRPPAPELPAEVAEGAARRYAQFHERLLRP
ncbi:MAG: phosphoribosylaminoimidazolesuccinocarboxamide synthase [Elusimicrobia bacterium]|nr:phosphoribosylaminoimidazolesuccinocarboxamide synthase [Elusimicrobiota bacterium]MDE2237685.1 phosphoribosylaminoimidazolesuccinocarboxamide synthase [Elusimicrobiota bacterium]MDE2425203.1 phosphoribosylaminoimidazolesuccinocarboxamide synthase [Elusimicrobiota bacterium]